MKSLQSVFFGVLLFSLQHSNAADFQKAEVKNCPALIVMLASGPQTISRDSLAQTGRIWMEPSRSHVDRLGFSYLVLDPAFSEEMIFDPEKEVWRDIQFSDPEIVKALMNQERRRKDIHDIIWGPNGPIFQGYSEEIGGLTDEQLERLDNQLSADRAEVNPPEGFEDWDGRISVNDWRNRDRISSYNFLDVENLDRSRATHPYPSDYTQVVRALFRADAPIVQVVNIPDFLPVLRDQIFTLITDVEGGIYIHQPELGRSSRFTLPARQAPYSEERPYTVTLGVEDLKVEAIFRLPDSEDTLGGFLSYREVWKSPEYLGLVGEKMSIERLRPVTLKFSEARDGPVEIQFHDAFDSLGIDTSPLMSVPGTHGFRKQQDARAENGELMDIQSFASLWSEDPRSAWRLASGRSFEKHEMPVIRLDSEHVILILAGGRLAIVNLKTFKLVAAEAFPERGPQLVNIAHEEVRRDGDWHEVGFGGFSLYEIVQTDRNDNKVRILGSMGNIPKMGDRLIVVSPPEAGLPWQIEIYAPTSQSGDQRAWVSTRELSRDP